MDRIDIHLDVMRVPFEKLYSLDGGEPSSAIRARVEASRAVQTQRFAPLGKPHVLVNGDTGPAEVQRFCQVDEEGKSLMRAVVRQMDLSVRSYYRVLKLARTVADLAGEENLQTQYLDEALQYRPRNLVQKNLDGLRYNRANGIGRRTVQFRFLQFRSNRADQYSCETRPFSWGGQVLA